MLKSDAITVVQLTVCTQSQLYFGKEETPFSFLEWLSM